MKKLLSIVLALMMAISCLAGISAEAFAAEPPQNGWYKVTETYENEDGETEKFDIWFYYQNGKYVTGWRYINKKWYFFDEDGARVTGWKMISRKWYYFSASGAMQVRWQKIGSRWYYFESSGAMATGWKQISGKWY